MAVRRRNLPSCHSIDKPMTVLLPQTCRHCPCRGGAGHLHACREYACSVPMSRGQAERQTRLVGAEDARPVRGCGDVRQEELRAGHLQRAAQPGDPAPGQQLPEAARQPASNHACSTHAPNDAGVSKQTLCSDNSISYFCF